MRRPRRKYFLRLGELTERDNYEQELCAGLCKLTAIFLRFLRRAMIAGPL